jgi:drug/metabolite transporter (DMT)-like permease
MNPAFAGALSALSLGTADFACRFSTRAVGAPASLVVVLTFGTIILSAWIALTGTPLIWPPDGLPYVALNGVSTTVMTLLLYKALARGPISVAAPIVASHPVLVVAFWVLVGARPGAVQWLAMAVTILGAITVAATAEKSAEPTGRKALNGTIALSCAAALAYAGLVIGGQAATPYYGPLQTLWLGRLFSLAPALLVLLAVRGRGLGRWRWWPFLMGQGVLDAGGYLALFAGSTGPGGEIAAVAASGFGAVTVILARLVLKEPMGWIQWLGVAMVTGGVAVLSGTGL